MYEQMGNGPDAEEKQRLEKIAQEEEEALQNYLAMHAEDFTKNSSSETGPEIAAFETLVASFEAVHSLEELHSIEDISPDLSELFLFAPILADPTRIEKDIQVYERHNPSYVTTYKEKIARLQAFVPSPEEKRIYEARIAARNDLNNVHKQFERIKNHSSFSAEQREVVIKKYKQLSNAVGIIRNNKVIHDL